MGEGEGGGGRGGGGEEGEGKFSSPPPPRPFFFSSPKFARGQNAKTRRMSAFIDTKRLLRRLSWTRQSKCLTASTPPAPVEYLLGKTSVPTGGIAVVMESHY